MDAFVLYTRGPETFSHLAPLIILKLKKQAEVVDSVPEGLQVLFPLQFRAHGGALLSRSVTSLTPNRPQGWPSCAQTAGACLQPSRNPFAHLS